MPIYEFICKNCGKKFETIVSLGKEKDIFCIKCESHDIQKGISSFGIKGTDNRTNSSNGCSTCSIGTCSLCK